MAVKIRLKRLGKIRAPYYRVVVMDSRTKRDGRAIEEIGKYHPTEEPSFIEINSERAQYWLSVGAQPTEQVAALLKVTGDWQKFKGEPGAEGTLRTAEAKPDKKAVFEAAAKQAASEPKDSATTPKKKAAPQAQEEQAVTEHAGLSERGEQAEVQPATATQDDQASSGAEVPTAPGDIDQTDSQPAPPTDAESSEA
ncbi:MAG TPA: 30S ribosomal protein S16 [Segeticoccus sp.]|uniref:30S ribosomal protein S16 n=1 Tax=Segeticoccus sp. TaxID=2706531 RepID=UPI002D80B4C0|nr:30S ribosomal protein S16 [Segeticoccus sp.]HET8601556.1 30S ribosomal protein S16 [Segeticoccus sp.]